MNHQDRDPEELLTLLREKEGKLQKTLEELSYLKSIVQNSEDAIIGIDLDGTIISWNPGAEKIHGFTASEAIGNSVSMLIPPYNTNEISLILAWIKSGERVDHYETLRRRKDGTLVDISLSISPVRDQDGEVVSVSTIARDITHGAEDP
jgi:PAS domain S-box-containing protein